MLITFAYVLYIITRGEILWKTLQSDLMRNFELPDAHTSYINTSQRC